MSIKTINAVVTEKPEKGIEAASVSFDFNVPDTVADYVTKYGEDVTKNILDQQLTIKLQAAARTKLTKGKTGEEIQAWAETFVPGVSPERKSPVDKIAALMAGLSPEQREALKSKVQEMKQGK